MTFLPRLNGNSSRHDPRRAVRLGSDRALANRHSIPVPPTGELGRRGGHLLLPVSNRLSCKIVDRSQFHRCTSLWGSFDAPVNILGASAACPQTLSIRSIP